MSRRRGGAGTLACAALCLPARAEAHAFQSGQQSYELLVQGIAQPWLALPVALVLVGAGVMLSIWREEGMLAAWPVVLVCAALGFGLGPFVPPVDAGALAVAGLAIGGAGVVAHRLPAALVLGLAGFAMLLGARYLVEDHPFGELPLAFLLGMGGGALSAVALPAGLVQASRHHLPRAGWVVIGWRALSSWIAAIAVLVLAFSLRGVG